MNESDSIENLIIHGTDPDIYPNKLINFFFELADRINQDCTDNYLACQTLIYLLQNRDFKVVNVYVWRFLKELYGGGT